ncbi:MULTISPECIES: PP2C family protein-serine/threonine phosphatase [unclassified Pseudofrankia]|uniref:PP2C family protein-serine/threonine phosphatase n=1 Tax=unclassified Pseudofrankia TaxID=2994372 RepID=UPI0008D915D6|nr:MULTISPECIES: PP2C family protein-serine/threonine phosphatase [unclassified Pseudofrankia]MDT3445928.1 PP2C family protein-serine/threonine phosphatase [Pseudofrankia sp. BMG5.37]OHV56727.1 serine/threonine protein phosphatase [Pseudofrankia sp. BMG5.36]
MPWKPDRALMLGLAVLACAVGIGLLANVTLAGYFGLSALLVSGARGPRRTAAIGGLAVVMAVLSGIWDHRLGQSQHLAAVGLVVAQSAVAVWIAVHRSLRESELRHRESELRQVRAVADVAQRALLPEVPTTIEGAALAARYLSAAEEASIGGDLYEVVATKHTIRVIIGDVRGKGLPAVRLASVVLGAFREAAVTWLEPEQVAAACAQAVNRQADAEDFVTALLLDIHPDGRLSLCSAGHHPPMHLSRRPPDGAEVMGGKKERAGEEVRLKSPSPPLGLAERFTPTAGHWAVGDRLLLFTDGLIEARSPGGEFFPLQDHLDVLLDGTLEESLDRLTERVTRHAGGHLRDDLAMLLIERRPLASEPTVPRQLSAADNDGPHAGSHVADPGAEPPAVATPAASGDPVHIRGIGPGASGWRRLRAGRSHRSSS